MAAENLQLFGEFRTGMESSHGEISGTVESCFVEKERRFEEALKQRFGVIADIVGQQRGAFDRIEGFAVALQESVGVALDKGVQAMERISAAEREQTKSFQEDMGGMRRMLDAMEEKWKCMEGLSSDKQKVRQETDEAVRVCVNDHLTQNRTAKEEGHDSVQSALKELSGAGVVLEERSAEAIKDSTQVEKIMAKAQERAQATREEFEGRLQEKVETFESNSELARKALDENLSRQSQESEVVQRTVTTIHQKAQSFVGDFDDFASGCVQTVKSFCGQELETYRPTGETPAKKNFNYPKALSQTSPHGRILQRFRYDPNNSFNSSSDILPGLDDDDQSPREANIEEGDERAVTPSGQEEDEEEEAVFEDAQEDSTTKGVKRTSGSSVESNVENENPNVQRKKNRGKDASSGTKAANRQILEVQQRDTIYVSSDDVSGGKGGGGGSKKGMRRSPLKTKSPGNMRSPLNSKSPVWRNS